MTDHSTYRHYQQSTHFENCSFHTGAPDPVAHKSTDKVHERGPVIGMVMKVAAGLLGALAAVLKLFQL